MAKLILSLGGAKSGKSLFAEKLAQNEKYQGRVAYIATAEAGDDEMKARVSRHKQRRPKEWLTIEAPFDLEKAALDLDGNIKFALIDCITLYITNMLLRAESETDSEIEPNWAEKQGAIIKNIENLCDVCKNASADFVMVSNEVGHGIVPINKLARVFTDIAGQANQVIAQKADEVYFLIAGIPQKIK